MGGPATGAGCSPPRTTQKTAPEALIVSHCSWHALEGTANCSPGEMTLESMEVLSTVLLSLFLCPYLEQVPLAVPS